jgi:hypothetical protein
VELDPVIFARLQSRPSLKALVGDRCYPEDAQQGSALPLVVWTYPTEESWNALDGETGTDQLRVQFDVYGSTRDQARAVLRELRAALMDWSSPVTVPRVAGCSRQNAVSGFDEDPAGSGTAVHRIVQDYLIWIE